MLTTEHVTNAMGGTPWNVGNQVLYDVCRQYPDHTDEQAVIAKIWLIGRTYAATIERRKTKGPSGDRFYLEVVSPKVRDSDLDDWLAEARAATPGTPQGLATLVAVHGRTMNLFKEISGFNKRSLASKYLHFHVPKLFYIYDARAETASKMLRNNVPCETRVAKSGDREYRGFIERCEDLRTFCHAEFGHNLSPRQLDNLLLSIQEEAS